MCRILSDGGTVMKRLPVWSIFVICCFFFSINVHAANSLHSSIYTEDTLKSGKAFNVYVSLRCADGIGAVRGYVQFDSEMMSLSSVSMVDKTDHDIMYYHDTGNGAVRYLYAAKKAAPTAITLKLRFVPCEAYEQYTFRHVIQEACTYEQSYLTLEEPDTLHITFSSSGTAEAVSDAPDVSQREYSSQPPSTPAQNSSEERTQEHPEERTQDSSEQLTEYYNEISYSDLYDGEPADSPAPSSSPDFYTIIPNDTEDSGIMGFLVDPTTRVLICLLVLCSIPVVAAYRIGVHSGKEKDSEKEKADSTAVSDIQTGSGAEESCQLLKDEERQRILSQRDKYTLIPSYSSQRQPDSAEEESSDPEMDVPEESAQADFDENEEVTDLYIKLNSKNKK